MIVGAGGQLGRALAAAAPAGAEVMALDSAALDITDAAAVAAAVRAARPALLFNAAAYTAVDRAEGDEAMATAVNGTAVGTLAAAAGAVGARLVHVSTDFVFDGMRATPYPPDAPTAPLSAYGRSKLRGEQLAGADALVVRTSWLHADRGASFVATMLRLFAERDVRVVADQIGSPTYAPGLAAALWQLAAGGARGLFHYRDSGVASWYDFAVAIAEEARAAGLLDRAPAIVPIATADYPTPARRPASSVLDTAATVAALGAHPPHWRVGLRQAIAARRA